MELRDKSFRQRCSVIGSEKRKLYATISPTRHFQDHSALRPLLYI